MKTNCGYVISEDQKENNKISYQQWLHRLTQDKPKLRCKASAFCDICGYCSEHCVRHVNMREHLDKHYRQTRWSDLGSEKDRKASYRIPAYQARGEFKNS